MQRWYTSEVFERKVNGGIDGGNRVNQRGEIFIGIAEANHVRAEKGHLRNKYVSLPPQASYPVCMRQCTQRQAAQLKYTVWRTHRVPTYGYHCRGETDRERERGRDRASFSRGPLSLTNQRTRFSRPAAPTYTLAYACILLAMCASHLRRVSKIMREGRPRRRTSELLSRKHSTKNKVCRYLCYYVNIVHVCCLLASVFYARKSKLFNLR